MNFDLLSVATVIANIAIAFTLLEGTALVLVHRLTGHGLEPKDYLLNLMAGFFLMLALRAGLGAVWTAVPLFSAVLGAGTAPGACTGSLYEILQLRSEFGIFLCKLGFTRYSPPSGMPILFLRRLSFFSTGDGMCKGGARKQAES